MLFVAHMSRASHEHKLDPPFSTYLKRKYVSFKAGLSDTPFSFFFQNSGEERQEQMPAVQFSLKQNYGWFVNCMPN